MQDGKPKKSNLQQLTYNTGAGSKKPVLQKKK